MENYITFNLTSCNNPNKEVLDFLQYLYHLVTDDDFFNYFSDVDITSYGYCGCIIDDEEDEDDECDEPAKCEKVVDTDTFFYCSEYCDQCHGTCCEQGCDAPDYPAMHVDGNSEETLDDDIEITPLTVIPDIVDVVFADPITVVVWDDHTTTVARCEPGDKFSKDVGLAVAIAKKAYGKGFYQNFVKWLEK